MTRGTMPNISSSNSPNAPSRRRDLNVDMTPGTTPNTSSSRVPNAANGRRVQRHVEENVPAEHRVVWGVRFGPGGTSYITANGYSEFGLIVFPSNGREGIYRTEPFPGSSSSPSSPLPAAPAPASDDSASLSPAGLNEQLSSLPVPDVPTAHHNNGSPNFSLCPSWYPQQHTHPGAPVQDLQNELFFQPAGAMPWNPVYGHQTSISPHGSAMGDASPATNSLGNSPHIDYMQRDSSFPVGSPGFSVLYSYGSASPGALSASSALSHNTSEEFLHGSFMSTQATYDEPQLQSGRSIRQDGLLSEDNQIMFP